jgi:hypothetical protein
MFMVGLIRKALLKFITRFLSFMQIKSVMQNIVRRQVRCIVLSASASNEERELLYLNVCDKGVLLN